MVTDVPLSAAYGNGVQVIRVLLGNIALETDTVVTNCDGARIWLKDVFDGNRRRIGSARACCPASTPVWHAAVGCLQAMPELSGAADPFPIPFSESAMSVPQPCTDGSSSHSFPLSDWSSEYSISCSSASSRRSISSISMALAVWSSTQAAARTRLPAGAADRSSPLLASPQQVRKPAVDARRLANMPAGGPSGDALETLLLHPPPQGDR